MTSILIAEDHEPAMFLRSRLLSSAGFAITETQSASATLDAVFNTPSPPALVLLDVGLPDGNGFDVCERIKASKPEIPVVLISAVYRTSQSRRDGLTAGADAYLVDPIPPERLIDTVRRLTSHADSTPAPPLAIVRTTTSGTILWVNDVAARLLNIGERAAPGRNILTFFNGGRMRLQQELARAAAGQVCEMDAALRPRERRPLMVQIDLASAGDGNGQELEWILDPCPTAQRCEPGQRPIAS